MKNYIFEWIFQDYFNDKIIFASYCIHLYFGFDQFSKYWTPHFGQTGLFNLC